MVFQAARGAPVEAKFNSMLIAEINPSAPMQTPNTALVLSEIPIADLAAEVSKPTAEALLSTLPEAVRRSRMGSYLNDKEAQAETGLSKRQLRYLREKRRIEYRLVGRTVPYPTSRLFDLIDAGTVPVRPSTRGQ